MNTNQPVVAHDADPARRSRVLVLGGSIAGTLAARVLSEHFTEVMVIDRDDLVDAGSKLRAGVPWAPHIHALLERGRRIIEDLYPGFTEEMRASGVPVGDYGETCHYYFNGQRFADHVSGMTLVGVNRPVIEHYLRARTMTLPNVRLMDRSEIEGLIGDSGGNVTGAQVRIQGEDATTAITADLVVDALGRRSPICRWLTELGYEPPPEEKVHMGLTYTTMDFVGPLTVDPIGEDIALVPTATPGHPRGAIFARLADRYSVTLTGIAGDRPPADREGFVDYARSLPISEVYDAIVGAQQRGPARSFGFPASIRRRFERLERLPEGLVVLGDAACMFNPVYAQGMTVAALGAAVLQRQLESSDVVRPVSFFAALAREIDAPWMISAAADLGYKQVRGDRTIGTWFGNLYTSQVAAGAATDPTLARAFMRVISLIDSPKSLMKPSIALRMLAVRAIQQVRGARNPTTKRQPVRA